MFYDTKITEGKSTKELYHINNSISARTKCCNKMFSFPVQIPVNGKSGGPPPSLCLTSLSLRCQQVTTEKTEPGRGLPCRHPASRGRGVLVQYCPQSRVELVGCGVCGVAKLCLKVFVEGGSVDGAEVAGYSGHRWRWSHGDIELCGDPLVAGLQGIRHFS